MPDPSINPVRYPTLFRYLSGLPEGINSYPQAMSSAAVADAPRQSFANELKRDDLPEPIKAMLATPWVRGTWVPEVHVMIVMALVRDIICKNDEKYLKYIFDTMKEQYSGALMRSVMFVLSPNVLCLATEKRWAAFKRGIPMKNINSHKEGCTIVIHYPPKLYIQCMLEGMAKSVEAAVSCTRVKSVTAKTQIVSDTECHFVLLWSS